MRFHFSRRDAFLWVAAMAILVNTLLLPLGGMLSTATGGKTLSVEICSVHGLEHVALPLDAGGKQQPQQHGCTGHCPFCAAHANLLAFLHSPIEIPVLPRARHFAPLFLTASQPLFAWLAPPSRGPPLFR